MAESFLNALHGDRYEAVSAGIHPHKINPYVVEVMAEVGIDISMNRSKSIEEFRGKSFDYVVTVCDHARETCPFFPAKQTLHKSFEDPSQFKGAKNEILQQVRHVRNAIRTWIKEAFGKQALEKKH
jgi:arsenate reductase